MSADPERIAQGGSKLICIRRRTQIALNLRAELVRREGRLQLPTMTPEDERRHDYQYRPPGQ